VGLSAQIPQAPNQPPSPFAPVGMVLRKQTAHLTSPIPVDNSQVFGLLTTPGAITPPVVGVGPEIAISNYIWMFSSNCELSLATGQMQMTDIYSSRTSFHFFTLSLLSNNMWPLPFGKAGHNSVFSDPTVMMRPSTAHELLVAPDWVMTHDMSTIATPAPWVAHFFGMKISYAPGLIGLPFTAQSFRIQDDWNIYTGVFGPTLFASDEIVFAIS
tara:strand:+ start:45512 stop:46153 length:642 start_codon:yes stop_codon:yes gene_type:complete